MASQRLGRALFGLAFAACASTSSPPPGWGQRELNLERRCQEGTSAACGELGALLIDRHASEKDVERGIVLLEIACGHEDLAACTALGLTYGKAPESRPRAVELLSKGCGQRLATACTGLGEITVRDPRADKRAARESLHAGCRLGDARGCELYAVEQSRPGFGNSPEVAQEYFALACGRGRRSSCHHLAVDRLKGSDQRDRAVAELIDNCSRGFAPSCRVAAQLFAPLLSSPADCSRAVPLATRACAGDDQEGCAIASACEMNGRNRAAAIEQLHAACAKGTGLACLYWADAQGGAGGEQLQRAYLVACQEESMGSQIACARAAITKLAAAKTREGAELTLPLLREACDNSVAEACCALAREHESGRWLPADPSKASELRQRAANSGTSAACR